MRVSFDLDEVLFVDPNKYEIENPPRGLAGMLFKDNREIVHADLVEILTTRHLSPDRLHANPDDDFCDPKVGMNESIVEKYVNEAEKTLKDSGECFEEPIMVAKLSDGEYMIINGHHRWAAAIKMGLDKVRVVIASPGEENLVGLL